MNGAHLHLILNHFPIVGLIFSLMLLGAALYRKSPELTRAAAVAFVAVALVAIPVYLTGEPAEEIVEHMPGFAEEIFERHETAGLVSLIALGVLGAVSLLGLVVSRGAPALPRWLGPTLLALGLAASAWVGWTSSLGGQITHEEARPGFNAEAFEAEEEEEESEH